MVAETPEELRLLHDKQAIEAEAGLETHVLEGDELRRFAPYLAPDLLGATYCPAEGHANPFLAGADSSPSARSSAAPSSATASRSRASTRGSSSARPPARFGRSRVVNAAGAWAAELAALSGLVLPIRAEGLHVNVTEPQAEGARAARPAHRPPAHAEAGRERHLHHRRRLAVARRGAPGALLDDLGERRRQRGRRRPRDAEPRRRARRAHVDGVMGGHGRPAARARRVRRASRLLRLHGAHRLHARSAGRPATGAPTSRGTSRCPTSTLPTGKESPWIETT